MQPASKRTDRVVRINALLYAIFWVGCGVAVALGAIDRTYQFAGVAATYCIGAGWLLLAWYNYRADKLSANRWLIVLVAYHLLSAAYVLWVTGSSSPVIYSWALLVAASGMYFGIAGGILSAVSMVLVLVIETGFSVTTDDVFTCATILFIGAAATYVIRQTQRDQAELDQSHQQASMSRDRTTTLINNLTDAVLSTDQNGIIVLYNAAALNLLDTNTDLIGKDIDEVLQLRDANDQPVLLADELYDTKIASTRDDLVTLISGEPARLEIAYSPIRSNYDEETEATDQDDVGGFMIIIRDVTTAKSLEEERDEFISVVSHELRTPITIAEGTISNAQVMLSHKNMSQQKISSAIDMAHDQVVFLARMVNDLSTLSRAERGVADETEIIDVNELVKEVYTEHKGEAADKGLGFDLHIPPKLGEIKASRLYLKELLQNFVTNAIKYTQSGSVSIDVRKTEDSLIEFAVSDTGIGISQADQKRIFEKFYRAEDYRTRESNGTGLGLYVAGKLARKLDTTINIKSRLNYGSRFSIKLQLLDQTDTERQS